MPRAEQTVAYSITPVAPNTAGTLPVFTTSANPVKASDSAYRQADNGRQLIAGLGATVNAGQVSPNPIIVIGDGATAWGIGAVAIGRNITAGSSAAKDGITCIGYGLTGNGKNGINIGSALAFGSTFDDYICIGTQASALRSGAIAIGMAASTQGTDGVGIGHSVVSSEGSSIAIGRGAACTNSGLGTPNKNIAIGDAAACSPSFASASGGVIAIGAGSTNNGQNTICIGAGATISGAGVVGSIAIGAGASTSRSFELVFGDNTNSPLTLVSVRAGAAAPVLHRVGGSGAWGIRDAGDANTIFSVDSSAAAGDVRMLVWDVTAGLLKRVTVGAADSGGVGFKLLRVAN